MGNWLSGMFRGRRPAPTTPAPQPAPMPETPEDPHAKADREYRERIAASHEALCAELARNGYTDVGFSGSPGGTHAERMDRIFRGWRS